MEPFKKRDEVEWIREQVYEGGDVTYSTQPYSGASVVRYHWKYSSDDRVKADGIGAIYGINREHAELLFHKWNIAGKGNWHYEFYEEYISALL